MNHLELHSFYRMCIFAVMCVFTSHSAPTLGSLSLPCETWHCVDARTGAPRSAVQCRTVSSRRAKVGVRRHPSDRRWCKTVLEDQLLVTVLESSALKASTLKASQISEDNVDLG